MIDAPDKTPTTPDIAIIGAGAFGTALACALTEPTNAVLLMGRDAAAMANMSRHRINKAHLPDIEIPQSIILSATPEDLSDVKTVLLAVPSAAQAEVLTRHLPFIAPDADIVMSAKGLDRQTGHPITRVLEPIAGRRRISVLSGPGFAADIARGLPTAMTLASPTLADAERLVAALSQRTLRLYASSDVEGVQISGALKNVLAIASGIVMGAKLGESARAALIARGLAELSRYVASSGGEAETVMGLSGLGDLVLTATSQQSRNYRFGMAIGEGAHIHELSGPGKPLVEGAGSAITAARSARDLGVSMPITDAVAGILSGKLTVKAAADELLSRPLQIETVIPAGHTPT